MILKLYVYLLASHWYLISLNNFLDQLHCLFVMLLYQISHPLYSGHYIPILMKQNLAYEQINLLCLLFSIILLVHDILRTLQPYLLIALRLCKYLMWLSHAEYVTHGFGGSCDMLAYHGCPLIIQSIARVVYAWTHPGLRRILHEVHRIPKEHQIFMYFLL